MSYAMAPGPTGLWTSKPEKVLVVGGSSGLGASVVKRAIQTGDVVSMQRTPALMGTSYMLDLRWKKEMIVATVESVLREWGIPDRVLLSGGVGAMTSPGVDPEQLAEIFETNVFGPMIVANHIAQYNAVHGKKSWRCVYVGSSCERNRCPSIEIYAAAKAAGSKYFREFGPRLKKWGVRSSVLVLGWFESPMTAKIKPAMMKRILESIPMGRLLTLKEVTDAAMDALQLPWDVVHRDVELTGGL